MNIQSVRSHLGLVSQEPVLFDMTIAENIAYGLENVPIEDIINAAARANIDQFICQLPEVREDKMMSRLFSLLFFAIHRAMKHVSE